MFNQTADGKGKAYVHKTQGADRIIGPPFEILSEKAIKHYEKMKDKGENVYIGYTGPMSSLCCLGIRN